MNTTRLLQVADLLDHVAEDRFAMDCWVGEDWMGAPDLSCGTVACAMGWVRERCPMNLDDDLTFFRVAISLALCGLGALLALAFLV